MRADQEEITPSSNVFVGRVESTRNTMQNIYIDLVIRVLLENQKIAPRIVEGEMLQQFGLIGQPLPPYFLTSSHKVNKVGNMNRKLIKNSCFMLTF